jgi:hypothetical protein
MKRIITLTILIAFAIQQPGLLSQNVINATYRPAKYDEPINPGPPNDTDIKGSSHWEVWSDRTNNTVYDAPNLAREVARVGFMEAFYVIESNDHVLQIARKEDFRLNTDGSRVLMHGKTPVGWIHADNLLLWSVCLKTDMNLDKKAMVLNNFRPGASIDEIRRKPAYFGDPRLRDTIGEVGLYEIGHVYKETTDAVLIGSSWGMQTNAKREMRGWVHEINVTPWNHRVAWEYNWHPEALKQRKWTLSDTLPPRGAIIWEDQNDGCRQGTLQEAQSNILVVENPLYAQRKPGTFNRFPVLELVSELRQQTARVGTIGTIVDKDGNPIDEEKIVEVQMAIEELEATRRNINILFVIDATASMEHFSRPVAQSIRIVMQELSGNTKNNYRFGATLFRDEAEGDKKFQHLGNTFTGNPVEVENWLFNNMRREHNRDDRDHPEALFYGITESIDVYLPNRKETNYLILIGDACDHDCQIDPATDRQRNSSCRTIEDVIQRLTTRNINLMAFQARYMNERDLKNTEDTIHFYKFNNQIQEILIGTASRIDTLNRFNLNEMNTKFGKYYELQNSPVIGSLNARKKGDTLSMDQLRQELIQTLNFIENNTNEQIELIADAVFRGIGLDDAAASQIVSWINSIMEMYPGITPEDLQSIFSGTRQFYREGYSCFQSNNELLPLYQPVILIENTDFRALRNFIKQLAKKETVNIYRQTLITIFGRIVNMYFGDMNQQDINNLPFCELLVRVTGGCNCKENWDFTIGDIPSLEAEMIMEIRDEFLITDTIISRIFDTRDRYNGRIPRANTPYTWWWIPCDVFPTSPKPDDVSLDDLYLR